ncbi:MAG: anaerobic ribonucleoside-triphosphate reductase activating protein [Candidatus Omnitrophica bacterium]|nr:anaerobic ribonucleoside-triphosphate reductase activating protein [Candidatus Omnitrophota bacterium]
MPRIGLPIGGMTPFTTIDFPGRLAAVLYTQGCAWRCRYCHNAHLWSFDAAGGGGMDFDGALDFLKLRRGLLDGVVFCGGEPTAHAALPDAMRAVKDLGFEAALHTTGMYPDRLTDALAWCDWVGLDIKAPFDDYPSITRAVSGGAEVRESLRRLQASGVDYETRTTVRSDLLSGEQILALAGDLRAMGVRRYVLQAFHPAECDGKSREEHGPAAAQIPEALKNRLKSLFEDFSVRE